MKTGIILQARTGSSRLPGKMILPFYNTTCIPEVITGMLKKHFPDLDAVVATTTNPIDDELARRLSLTGCAVFRGDEQDVLGRFIACADFYGFDRIIRVCADNPLLSPSLFAQLLRAAEDFGGDYITFQLPDGTPAPKTHYGLFAEWVTTDALKRVAAATTERFYHEHVTIYIYTHPETFRIKWLSVPEVLSSRQDIRLTIDTATDFELAAKAYRHFAEHAIEITPESLLAYLDARPEMTKIMAGQISGNTK